MASTPTFSWPTPDDTDLVRDGAAAIRALGDAADLTVSNLTQNVVSTVKTDTFTSSSTSFDDVSDLEVTITPRADTSKILVIASVSLGVDSATVAAARLMRDSTPIFVGDTVGSRTSAAMYLRSATAAGTNLDPLQFFLWSSPMVVLDDPNTDQATTYKIQVISLFGTNVYLNRSGEDGNAATRARLASSITAIEVTA